VPRYRFVPAVEADIERALRYTRRRFGHAKYLEYAALIEEALQALGANARSGKLRPLIHPDAWIYEIAQPGRKARHLFLYEIVDDVRTFTASSTTGWICPPGGSVASG